MGVDSLSWNIYIKPLEGIGVCSAHTFIFTLKNPDCRITG